MVLRVLLVLALFAPVSPVEAQQRFSLLLTGSYTELDGGAAIDARVTPLIFLPPTNPFEPPSFEEGDPIRLGGQVPFDTEEVSWEIAGAWAILPNLQLIAGYTDFGSFNSEPLFASDADFLPVPIGIPSPGLRPLPPILPLPPEPPLGGFVLRPQQASLDVEAWLFGLRGTHDLNERFRIFGRLGGLRASFDVDGDFGERFELLTPSDENGWFWGVGVQYRLMPRLLVGVGYTQYDVDLQKLDSYQLSIEALVF